MLAGLLLARLSGLAVPEARRGRMLIEHFLKLMARCQCGVHTSVRTDTCMKRNPAVR